MQVTKKSKYTILISIFILIFFFGSAQENIENTTYSDTLITQNDSTQTKHKFSFSGLFKKKNKYKDDDETDNVNDTTSKHKHKFSFKNLFKRKNKQDSTISENDSLINDSSKQKKRFGFFSKNKSDTAKNSEGLEKPQRLSPSTWNELNANEQDSLLRAWDNYDKEHYKKKYAFTPKEKERDMKREKTFFDKLILRRAVNKPYKYKKKLINRKIGRYKKTMLYDRFDKSETAPNDTISDKKRYQLVNKEFKRDAKQEAIRKNKVSLKYDRKEERLRKHYTLSDNEMIILNKGKGVPLKSSEKIIFNKARRKQEKFSEKLLKLRQKRSFALQNKDVQKKMKADQKRIARRDKTINKNLRKKKRNKDKNKKHDSSEYPKRWF